MSVYKSAYAGNLQEKWEKRYLLMICFPYENESHRLYWVIVIVLGFRTDYRFRRNWVLLDLIVWFDLPWIIAINHIWLDLIVIILDFISSHFIAFNMIKFVWFWIRCYCMLLALIIFYRILFDLILLTFDFIGLNHIWSHWMLLHCSELESTVFYWMLTLIVFYWILSNISFYLILLDCMLFNWVLLHHIESYWT